MNKLHKRRVTGLSNTTRNPIKAVSEVTRDFLQRFKSRRHKSKVVAVSNQASACHSNFDISEKVAATTDVQPSEQPAATCLTLDDSPPDPVATTKTSHLDDPDDLQWYKLTNKKVLAAALLEHLSSNASLGPQLKLYDHADGNFKTCPHTSSSAPQRRRHRTDKRQERRGNSGQRGDTNRGDPGDEGNDGGGRKKDGLRFPKSEGRSPLYDCPFHKSDPDRYDSCHGFRRFCDLKTHLERQHVLKGPRPYCPRCRIEFFQGDNPQQSRDLHVWDGTCTEAFSRETGVMIPDEYNILKENLGQMGNYSSVSKWQYVWICIFGTRPPSPFVGDYDIGSLDATVFPNYSAPGSLPLGTAQPSAPMPAPAQQGDAWFSDTNNPFNFPVLDHEMPDYQPPNAPGPGTGHNYRQ